MARARRLVASGLMTPAGAALLPADLHPNDNELVIASDVEAALRANAECWRHVQELPQEYVRIRLAYLETQRGKAGWDGALANFIAKTARGQMFGMCAAEFWKREAAQ
jgi:hypothetical protein